MYRLALWRIIHTPHLVVREAYLATNTRREVAVSLCALHDSRDTNAGATPGVSHAYIFPANVGDAPAIFAERYCKSGSFCNPNRAI